MSAPMAVATSYVDESEIQFTFNPMLTMSLSSSDMVITDLIPGNSENSNAVTVTVGTNNVYGYALSASVGDGTTYTSTSLTRSGGGEFASISSESASLSSGTWGFSTCVVTASTTCPSDANTNWSNYKGFSAVSTDVPLRSYTDGAPQTAYDRETQFRFGAYAAAGQTMGMYNNVINFKAVSRVETPPQP